MKINDQSDRQLRGPFYRRESHERGARSVTLPYRTRHYGFAQVRDKCDWHNGTHNNLYVKSARAQQGADCCTTERISQVTAR